MAEITNLFKATIKTVRTRLKSQGVTLEPDKGILGNSKKSSDFVVKSKQVVRHITTLRDYLLQHRKDYINAAGYLGEGGSSMTDAERDQIDSEAENVMKACSSAIAAFKAEALSHGVTGQLAMHRKELFRILLAYLKGVCLLYSSQRAVRVKRTVDRKRISRLQPEGHRSSRSSSSSSSNIKSDSFVSRLEVGKKEKGPVGHVPERGSSASSLSSTTRQSLSADYLCGLDDEDDNTMTAEEAQMMEVENEQLYQEMNSLVDEVRQIEGKVVEISKLQQIFSEKVLEQDKDVETIATTVVGATENIKEANEDIREAMKNNAGLRVWILFFLIVCTLSLLFLDWYNP